ncbi:MAG: hypothetical protein B6U78_01335 [Candidatus Aenigmarchaeota archaeon ex4484_224]|nr:MAG: hypothetical protein B6U78_01335 [Candidatus Aenigmarchaeota archaeon ex4484_224]
MGWRWRWGWKGKGRIPRWIYLQELPRVQEFVPEKKVVKEPMILSYAEFEAIRLIDLEDLTVEEAGKRMNVSRGTVWRLINSARKKIAKALVEGRPIKIESLGEIERI